MARQLPTAGGRQGVEGEHPRKFSSGCAGVTCYTTRGRRQMLPCREKTARRSYRLGGRSWVSSLYRVADSSSALDDGSGGSSLRECPSSPLACVLRHVIGGRVVCSLDTLGACYGLCSAFYGYVCSLISKKSIYHVVEGVQTRQPLRLFWAFFRTF